MGGERAGGLGSWPSWGLAAGDGAPDGCIFGQQRGDGRGRKQVAEDAPELEMRPAGRCERPWSRRTAREMAERGDANTPTTRMA